MTNCSSEIEGASDPVILGGFRGMRLVDLHFHQDWDSWKESFIELLAVNGDKTRHMRFDGVTNLKIDEGFSGSLSGMEILDISARQWYCWRIEVRNTEQDPGITFLANRMKIISDT